MPKPKNISFKGKTYPTIKAFARAFGKHPTQVAKNLRNGWSLEEIVGLAKRNTALRTSSNGIAVVYNNISYKSLAQLCADMNLPYARISARLRLGYSINDAVEGKFRPKTQSLLARKISVCGIEYPSGTAAAKAYNQKWSNVVRRMSRGWTISQALLIDEPPPRFRNFEGHARSIKWKSVRLDSQGNVEPKPSTGGFKLYEIRNSKNKKTYIGTTVGSLEARLKQHFSAARRGRRAPLQNAIRHYGEKCFSIHLLRNDARSYVELQTQEVAAIAENDTIRTGYNAAFGGSIGTAKPITIRGIRFPSLAQAAEHYGVSQAAFLLRMNRLGWSAEEAAELEVRRRYGKRSSISVQGKLFRSLRSAAEYHGVNYKLVHQRVGSGWSVDQALGLSKAPPNSKTAGIALTFNGRKYQSLRSLCREYGINASVVARRVRDGVSMLEAIRLTIERQVPQRGNRKR